MRTDAGSGWFTRGVRSVAAASFLSDAGHEMATSVQPTFLTTTLGAGPAALGAIEGASDALIGVSKLAGGPLAANCGRRGRIASGGYVVTAVATSAIGLATAAWQVALLRALAWVSHGVRSPARDTLLMSLVPRAAFGRAASAERAVSGRELSERCATLGHPMPRNVIANLESGRKTSLPVHELVVLATALGVPPVSLLYDVTGRHHPHASAPRRRRQTRTTSSSPPAPPPSAHRTISDGSGALLGSPADSSGSRHTRIGRRSRRCSIASGEPRTPRRSSATQGSWSPNGTTSNARPKPRTSPTSWRSSPTAQRPATATKPWDKRGVGDPITVTTRCQPPHRRRPDGLSWWSQGDSNP